MKRKALLIPLLLSLALLAETALTTYGEKKEPSSFTLSSNPRDTILSISSSGGYGDGDTAYALTGDGLFRRTFRPGDSTREFHLSYTEMIELVSILVEGDFMNWTQESITRRFEESIGHIPTFTDLPTVRLKLSLESLNGSGPLTNEFAYSWDLGLIELVAPQMELPEALVLDAFWRKTDEHFPKGQGDE